MQEREIIFSENTLDSSLTRSAQNVNRLEEEAAPALEKPSVFLSEEEASEASKIGGLQEREIVVSENTVNSSFTESLTSLDSSKESTLSRSDATPLMPLASLKDPHNSNFKSEGSLGASGSLGSTISKSLSSSIRTGNLSNLLDELTATVSQARLNSTNGQNITFQFRSDVLDMTSVRINANTKQMEVAFSTRSAVSNTMLNNHLTTLQNHLAALCPGQAVEVKTQFLASQNSSEFSSDGDSQDDFSNLNQENRGDFQDHGDTL